MPLTRRVPKRGFKNPFRKEYAVVKMGDLALFKDTGKAGIEDFTQTRAGCEAKGWDQASG